MESSQRENSSAVLFPARLLGMGLLFTWDWSLSNDLITTGRSQLWGSPLNFSFFVIAAEALMLIGLACASRRIGYITDHRALLVSGLACGAAGPLVALLAQAAGVGEPLLSSILCVTGLLCGFSFAVVLLAWAEVYGRMEPGRVFTFGALSLVAGALAYLFLLQSGAVVRMAATFCLPVISYTCCHLSSAFAPRAESAAHEGARYTFPWKPVLVMGVCGFAAAFIDIALFNQGTMPHVLADLICGGALIVLVVLLKRRVKPVALVGASLACMIAGIACVALAGVRAAFAASLLAMLSYVVITFFTYALLANKCYRHDIPSLWLFGFAMAARVIMDHLGGFARMAFPQLADMASSQLDLAVMAVVGLVAMVVVGAVWLSERSFDSSWAIERIDAHPGASGPSAHEILVGGCERLAAERALTDREAEVLGMLVEGRSYQEICSSLLLSPNTVKTHARHAYGKLGVHTREEAVELAREAGTAAL